MDMKRVEGSSALIGEHTSSTPFQISPWRRATPAELSRPNRHSIDHIFIELEYLPADIVLARNIALGQASEK
jgi:hypothetical protein